MKGLNTSAAINESITYTLPTSTDEYLISFRFNIKRNGGSASDVSFQIGSDAPNTVPATFTSIFTSPV